jgi:hypothetical protein
MTVLNLLLYRGTLVALNGLVLLVILVLLLSGERIVPLPRILFIAPALAVAAFATARGLKPLLIAAILANVLALAVGLPFLYFAVANNAPLVAFSLMSAMLFVVPLLTIIGCSARWPRRASI